MAFNGLPSIRMYREYALDWYSLWKDGKLALHWKDHVRMEIEKDIRNAQALNLAEPNEWEIAKEIDKKFKTRAEKRRSGNGSQASRWRHFTGICGNDNNAKQCHFRICLICLILSQIGNMK